MPNMDYSLIQRTPDGTGKILVTIPGIPDKGSYVLEADLKIYTNQGMVAIADIVDDLVTADATKPLSANQGVVLKQLIDAVSGGITPKGDILSSNLPAADASNKGWQYYCTDLNKYATSDGTQWVYTSNSIIVQTPDATDTGHALSNAVVTQKCNAVEATLNQHDARLQNLEQKAGDYSVVQYRGTDAVPTGKASYGLVKNIVGKSRAWNQILDSSVIVSTTVNGVTIVNNNDGSLTLYGECSATTYLSFGAKSTTIIGHKYLALFNKSASVDGIRLYNDGGGIIIYGINDDVPIISEATDAKNMYIRLSVGFDVPQSSPLVIKPLTRDVTTIFPEVASADLITANILQLVQKCPDLLKYDAYNTSLVDETLSGAKSKGVNIWDEEWEVGGIDGVTGADVTDSTKIRSKNYIPLDLGVEYYCKSINTVGARYYDSSKTFISPANITDRNFTPPSNAFYLRFQVIDCSSYNHDIQICLNSYSDKTTYHPYKSDTLSLSETVTLREIDATYYDELIVETGKKTKRIGRCVIDGTNVTAFWTNGSDSAQFLANSLPDGAAIYQSGYTENVISDKYGISTNLRLYGESNIPRFMLVDSSLSAYMGTTTALNTYLQSHPIVVHYPLATPTTESIDPIIDNFIEVEGDGTINTIQEQTPVIDNCLDVGYLAV